MKQAEHSNSTVSDNLEYPQSRERGNKNQRVSLFRGKVMKIFLVAFGFAFLITVYLLANKSVKKNSSEIELSSKSETKALEIEVLDGAGNMRVAQYLTNVIRSQGYDVVEMKRNSGGIVDRTFMLDRSGNLDEARKLAAILGIPQDKIFQKIDRNLYLDITVIVGKDYSQLKAFQSTTERKKH